MPNKSGNPCIRCGKERMVLKTWVVKTEYAPITHTMMVCPDPKCQAILDKMNEDRKDKRVFLEKQRVKSAKIRSKRMAKTRADKKRDQ